MARAAVTVVFLALLLLGRPVDAEVFSRPARNEGVRKARVWIENRMRYLRILPALACAWLTWRPAARGEAGAVVGGGLSAGIILETRLKTPLKTRLEMFKTPLKRPFKSPLN